MDFFSKKVSVMADCFSGLNGLFFRKKKSGVFFVIYRQSDAKGFRKWWVSLKRMLNLINKK